MKLTTIIVQSLEERKKKVIFGLISSQDIQMTKLKDLMSISILTIAHISFSNYWNKKLNFVYYNFILNYMLFIVGLN